MATRTKKSAKGPMGTSGVYGVRAEPPGFSPPPPATIQTYRLMRNTPTVAIARVAACMAIKAAGWTVEVESGFEDAPEADELKQAVERHVVRKRARLLKHLCTALDYGFASFEQVWGMNAGSGVVAPTDFVPFLPEQCEALVYEDTGEWAGATLGKLKELPPAKVLWYSYDSEADGHYGRSRNENIRDVWQAWTDSLKRLGQYTGKIAGVIPMVQYPEGESVDAYGQKLDNFELARRVLEQLGKGHGVAMPNVLARWAEDAVQRGIDPAGIKAWLIEFLQPGSGAGAEIIDGMRYLDSLILRGWIVPERAVTEGQYGTKAEAETHADFVAAAAEEVAAEMADAVDKQTVQPMAQMTYGASAVGMVRLRTSPIEAATREWLRGMVASILTQPANLDVLIETVRLDEMLERSGVPVRDDVGLVQDSAADGRIAPPVPAAAPGLPGAGPGFADLADLARSFSGEA